MKRDWNELVREHNAAVAAYASAARAVPAELWTRRQAEGKWSPAQITQHLILAFQAVQRELTDGVPMKLRTKWYHRLLLRFTIQRRLMTRGIFPNGAPAPRESRPSVVTEDAATLVARFEAAAAGAGRELAQARAARPDTRLTHPYFGRIPADEAIYISARHLDHHRGQLPAPPA